MSNENIEQKCLMDTPPLSPLYQIEISGCRLCLESYQQISNKNKVKPHCQYCSNNTVIVSNNYDILGGIYSYCKYKNDSSRKKK